MRLLITGASGFIGNYFLNKYRKKYDINTFSFRKNKFSDLVLTDVDTIVHLSALVHQMGGATKDEYEKINVEQTISLAKKAKASGVRNFIFMSTVKVFGEETNIPYNEGSKCYPEDDYGKSKLKAEQLLKDLENESFIITIIRTPIVYGFGVKANIKSLVSLVNKISILPFACINNRRSMVYIGNLCHLIDVLIDKRISGVFLASDNSPLSTTELCEMIALNSSKKVYLLKIPFFKFLLKKFKPSFYQRLYESLEINNQNTINRLNLINPYSIKEGIYYMIKGEDK